MLLEIYGSTKILMMQEYMLPRRSIVMPLTFLFTDHNSLLYDLHNRLCSTEGLVLSLFNSAFFNTSHQIFFSL